MNFKFARTELIKDLSKKGIKDPRVLEALYQTPRHEFVDVTFTSRAYQDMSLPIGFQQTISQPYVVAKMTEILRNNRNNGISTFIGPHKSELLIFKRENKQEIKYCSTGEQKVMLISLIFKHCDLMESIYNQTPILLLDDIIEHLDDVHKRALFQKTSEYKSQCWFTCTNSSSFKEYPVFYKPIDVNKLEKNFPKKSELKYA